LLRLLRVGEVVVLVVLLCLLLHHHLLLLRRLLHHFLLLHHLKWPYGVMYGGLWLRGLEKIRWMWLFAL